MSELDLRPVWLLDVDGVLNATRPRFGSRSRDGVARSAGRTYRMRWSPRLISAIVELHREGAVEMRWATTWVDDILEVKELMGLPQLPVAFSGLGAAPAVQARLLKLQAALSVLEVERRPLVWTDDVDIPTTGTAAERLRDSGLPALLLRPDARFGLRPAHVRAIRAFLDDPWA